MIMGVIGICTLGCNDSNKEQTIEESRTLDFQIETNHGELPGGFRTMDEYYVDSKGNKKYHGYRKNLYPSGMSKTVSYYEHGTLKWTEKYDEAGNVLSSDRK